MHHGRGWERGQCVDVWHERIGQCVCGVKGWSNGGHGMGGSVGGYGREGDWRERVWGYN